MRVYHRIHLGDVVSLNDRDDVRCSQQRISPHDTVKRPELPHHPLRPGILGVDENVCLNLAHERRRIEPEVVSPIR